MDAVTQQLLNDCTIDGNIVRLPAGQLDRKQYDKIKVVLEGIGGKWKGGKVAGFVFSCNPDDLMDKVRGGEKINLKKEHIEQYQFFATPDRVADKLVEMAGIKEPCKILEPSAGDGAIVRAIHKKFPTLSIDCFELMPDNQDKLKELSEDIDLILWFTSSSESDFLKAADAYGNDMVGTYDYIVANPPFSKNRDIQHVTAMVDMLKEGGRLVAVMSAHFSFAPDTSSVMFRELLKKYKSNVYDMPAGAFKESGANVNSKIVVIDKIKMEVIVS